MGSLSTSTLFFRCYCVASMNENEPPEFEPSLIELEIAENTATNTNIGGPVAATDPESDELTYSLAGVDAASFDIGPLTGQIKTEDLLDHESPSDVGGDNVYELTLQVTDGRDADGNADTAVDDTVSVAITVTEMIETQTTRNLLLG